jgi:hypothetical protein
LLEARGLQSFLPYLRSRDKRCKNLHPFFTWITGAGNARVQPFLTEFSLKQKDKYGISWQKKHVQNVPRR